MKIPSIENMPKRCRDRIVVFSSVHLDVRGLLSWIFVSSGMTSGFKIFLILIIFGSVSMRAVAGEKTTKNKVLHIAQKMTSAFQKVEDYTCEVDQIYYEEGIEDQRYRFKYYFRKEKEIRVDFSQPYPGMTVLYSKGSKEATVIPFQFFPALRFHFSIEKSMLKTPTGQRLDQTDMGYFTDFLFQNLKEVKQYDHKFQEDGETATFLLWALDYIKRERVEKYKIVVSKKNWLPILIERYNLEGKLIETSRIKNYTINTHLGDRLFDP